MQWKASSTLTGHTDSVTNICALADPITKTTFVASCGVDGILCIWERKGNDENWTLAAQFKFNNKMVECVSMFLLPNSNVPCVAAGGVDSNIYLYIKKENQYSRMCTLQGHQDWIRAMTSTVTDDGSILLASASQDTKIRLWKVSSVQSGNEQQDKADSTFLDEEALSKQLLDL